MLRATSKLAKTAKGQLQDLFKGRRLPTFCASIEVVGEPETWRSAASPTSFNITASNRKTLVPSPSECAALPAIAEEKSSSVAAASPPVTPPCEASPLLKSSAVPRTTLRQSHEDRLQSLWKHDIPEKRAAIEKELQLAKLNVQWYRIRYRKFQKDARKLRYQAAGAFPGNLDLQYSFI
ncbi:hypothetical protein WJX73_004813 [Symbiochloris irregularis]|uniref:Uncharacterized protein n=1 Tax=Symbiochloris irregularis TaxID=706552 RepID=A0AAW1Q098_9CHLO